MVMGGSGGYRRLLGGSAHFSLQTNRHTLHHNIYITIVFNQIRNLYKPEPEQVEGAAQEVGPVDNTLGKIFLNLTNCCASKSYECSAGQLFLLLHGKILSELFLNMMFLFRAGFRISLQPIIDEIQFHNYFQYIPNPMGPNCPL